METGSSFISLKSNCLEILFEAAPTESYINFSNFSLIRTLKIYDIISVDHNN